MFKRVEAITGNSFVDEEKDNRDLIFNDTPNPTDSLICKSHDSSYGNNDHSTYYFSTMGDDVHVIHSNNMVTPVRKKMSINTYRAYDKMMNGLGMNKPNNGVYIIEYYNIYNSSRIQGDRILDHYLSTDNLEYSSKVVDDITATIKMSRGKRGVYENKQIRIITFIPETDLLDKHYVYVKGPNLLVTYGSLDNSVCHPKSDAYSMSGSKELLLKEQSDNVVVIDIVDNDNSEPYYIKIGNEIQKLFPNKSTSYEEGVCISTKRNGIVVRDRTVDLKDHEAVGLFKTRTSCIADGDLKSQLERESLAHEKDKLKFEHTKLEASYEKLVAEKESMITKQEHEKLMNDFKINMSRLDYVKKEQEIYYDRESKLFDINTKVAINIMDMEQKSMKHHIEMEQKAMDIKKAKIENSSKNITNAITLVKSIVK